MIVVSDSGIQTPFLIPNDAQRTALSLAQKITESGFALPRSYIFAIRLEQLPMPVIYPQKESALFGHLHHPDGRVMTAIKYRYGKNFVERQLREAFSLGLDAELKIKQPFHPDNMDEPLYSGRRLGVDPFYSYARNDSEARYIIFATANYADAARYCGYKKNEQKYGFIHQYKKSTDQQYYDDYGAECALNAQTSPEDKIETFVTPDNNLYQGAEIYMGTRYFEVPLDEEKWEVFLEYHRAAYENPNPIMVERRKNILAQSQANHGQAVCYTVFGDEANCLSNFDENLLLSIDEMTDKVKEMKENPKEPSITTDKISPSQQFLLQSELIHK